MEREKIQADFPMLNTSINGKRLVYLDNAATTQKPQAVIDSIVDYYTTMNCNIHRGVHHLGQQASAAYESVRSTVHQFLKSSSEKEIIFTSGTTESLNLIAHSFGENFVQKGDEIIISEMEHHANIVPWQMICEKRKATLKVIPFDDKGILCMDHLHSLLSNKTKLISLTYVSNALGTINPIKEVIKLAHDHDVPVVVDGAQAVQHRPVDVTRLDCDFLVFSGHKIYAETGVGVLYGKEEWLESMTPYHYGGGMISSVSFEKTMFADIPFKFEAGTRNISAVISLGAALEYVSSIGMDHIQSHERDLLSYALGRLDEIQGVVLYGQSPKRSGIISLNLESVHHYDAAMILDQMGVAIRSGTHCAMPVMDHFGITGTIRASLALYNTYYDIDRFIDGLKKVKEMHG